MAPQAAAQVYQERQARHQSKRERVWTQMKRKQQFLIRFNSLYLSIGRPRSYGVSSIIFEFSKAEAGTLVCGWSNPVERRQQHEGPGVVGWSTKTGSSELLGGQQEEFHSMGPSHLLAIQLTSWRPVHEEPPANPLFFRSLPEKLVPLLPRVRDPKPLFVRQLG